MLLIQQPQLISHLRTEHKQKGRPLFSDKRAFLAMSRAFICMLNDPRLLATYFIVDALDECDQGLADLLKLISTSLKLTDKVKWLVSSCPDVNDLARLEDLDTVRNLIELNAQSLEGPVNMYIDYKLFTLKKKVGYSETTLAKVSNLVH
jgi:ABC-type cobalamin transport system ATPase subunit